MSRQPTCGRAEARARASVARRYLDVAELAAAENDRELTRVIARYGRVDLLCLAVVCCDS